MKLFRCSLWLFLLPLLLCMPAHAQLNPDVSSDTAQWYNKTHAIREVTVKKKRQRYQRKNNPAVELMRRVIAAKHLTLPTSRNLHTDSFADCRKYQKIVLAANAMSPEVVENGVWKMLPGVGQLLTPCPYNQQLILPLALTEQVTHQVARHHPQMKNERLLAQRSTGIGELFRSGHLINDVMRDFFTDVRIYDEDIRLLQHTFLSPIADRAIQFYNYYIIDTTTVDTDPCIHLFFRPANPLDFGFSGHLYVMHDGSDRVRRCVLNLPPQTTVNFVDRMVVLQDFQAVDEHHWILVSDDMILELSLFDFLERAVAIRNTRYQGHRYKELADSMYRRPDERAQQYLAEHRSHAYWEEMRPISLSSGEQRLPSYMEQLTHNTKVGWMRTALSLLVENYVETGRKGHDNLLDIGPLTSMVSANDVDGLRTRIGGKTTALLHPHLFLEGYYARGWRSSNDYYQAKLTYSLTPKTYLAEEFPMRSISVESSYDVSSPSDRFLAIDKDNVFMAMRWSERKRQVFTHRQQLTLDREERCGLRTTLRLACEEQELAQPNEWGTAVANSLDNKLHTTALTLSLRYAPGEKLLQTKQRRRPLNLDAPVLTLSHTFTIKGFLGGEVRGQATECSLFRRFWLNSWGKLDLRMAGVVQWQRVPILLLPSVPANLSYITRHGTFALVNDMELMADRYVMGQLMWDLNGKLFNRVPLFQRLKWRELLGVRALWGTLSEKNASQPLPRYSYPLDEQRPYIECVAGIHNIFRFFHVEYVRRFSYLHLPTAHKQGIRMKVSMKF